MCVCVCELPNDLSIKTHTCIHHIYTNTIGYLFVFVRFFLSSNSRITECVQIRSVVLQTILKHIFTAKKAKYKNLTHIHVQRRTHTCAYAHITKTITTCVRNGWELQKKKKTTTKKCISKHTTTCLPKNKIHLQIVDEESNKQQQHQ